MTILVDAHLDLAFNAVVLGRDLRRPVAEIRERERETPPPDPLAGTCMVSLPALLEGRIAVVGASIFTAPYRRGKPTWFGAYRTFEEAHRQGVTQLDFYRHLAEEDARVHLLRHAEDLERVLDSWQGGEPQLGLFIVMEGADPIRRAEELSWWVERGLRGVGLAWGAGTRYAGGNHLPAPVSKAGWQLLDAMAEHNLMLDISHLAERATYEVLDRYPGPIAATHANPRAFVDSPRQLSDDLIRRLAERGGVAGVALYAGMLQAGWRHGDPAPPLTRVVEAIDYICQLTGTAEAAGLGSDLDGGFGREDAPQGLDTIADLKHLALLLAERGYDDAAIAAILAGNWLRVMRNTLQD